MLSLAIQGNVDSCRQDLIDALTFSIPYFPWQSNVTEEQDPSAKAAVVPVGC